MQDDANTGAAKPPRLLEQLRDAIHRRHYSPRTEETYVHWGRRLRECLKLRVKDVAFEYRQILVRDGKGAKDRVTMLPQSVIEPLQAHLVRVQALHEQDLAAGYGEVELPDALARKYPKAPYEWAWTFVFPSH